MSEELELRSLEDRIDELWAQLVPRLGAKKAGEICDILFPQLASSLSVRIVSRVTDWIGLNGLRLDWWYSEGPEQFLSIPQILAKLLEGGIPTDAVLIIRQNLGSLIQNPFIHNCNEAQAQRDLAEAQRYLAQTSSPARLTSTFGGWGQRIRESDPTWNMTIIVFLMFIVIAIMMLHQTGLGSFLIGAAQGGVSLAQSGWEFVLGKPSQPAQARPKVEYQKSDAQENVASAVVPTSVPVTPSKPSLTDEQRNQARKLAHQISALLAGGQFSEVEQKNGFGSGCRLGTDKDTPNCLIGSLSILEMSDLSLRAEKTGVEITDWQEVITSQLHARFVNGDKFYREYQQKVAQSDETLNREPDIVFIEQNLKLLQLMDEAGSIIVRMKLAKQANRDPTEEDVVLYTEKLRQIDAILAVIKQKDLSYCQYLVVEAKEVIKETGNQGLDCDTDRFFISLWQIKKQ